MKSVLKILSVLLTLVLVLTFFACDSKGKEGEKDKKDETTTEQQDGNGENDIGDNGAGGNSNGGNEVGDNGDGAISDSENNAGDNSEDDDKQDQSIVKEDCGIQYILLDNGTYEASLWTKTPDIDLEIAATINGKAVTSIAVDGFRNAKDIEKIYISDGVKRIGRAAFASCDSLSLIRIPDSIEFIESDAFMACPMLEYEMHDNGKYLGNETNPYCVLIDVIDNDVRSFSISQNTRVINYMSLRGCLYIENVSIPASVVGIGDSAFGGMHRLKEITIPKTVKVVGNSILSQCSELTTVVLPEGMTTIPAQMFYNCSSLRTINIPSTVKGIEYYAFAHCEELSNITIGKNIEYIKHHAFDGCTSLSFADFVETDGWWRTKDEGAMSGTKFTPAELDNTSMAATYLTSYYVEYFWKFN